MFVVITPEGGVYMRSPESVTVAPGYRCLPEERPEHDSATQRLVPPAEPIPEDAEAYAWTVEDIPPPTLDQRKAGLKAAAATRRYEKEVSGILWQRGDGAVYYISTDREVSQQKLLAERAAALDGLRQPDDPWKCGDPLTGNAVFIDVSDAEIVAIANASRAHVAACFRRERDIFAAIDAAEDEAALAAIDITAGWPGRE